MPMNANFAPRPRAILATLLVLVATLQAGELAEVFQDHMVLQRDARVCIWGRGTPGEKVVVSFAGQTAAATVDTSGQWRAFLDPMAASVEPRALVVRGRNTREVRDVLVGEVWLAGGQSNMGSRMQEYAETASPERRRRRRTGSW
jgi:sialate O-acetylesterase